MKQAFWLTLLLATGALIASLQMDRQALSQAKLASDVPTPFRAAAQERLARQAVANQNGLLALIEARSLLAKRPIPAGHVRLLAQARILTDDPQAASLAFQVAAARGWRDPATQEAMARLALAVGVEQEALRRYAALMARAETSDDLLSELGAKALASAKARSQFAQLVARSDRWKSIFLRRGSKQLPPNIFADVTVAAIGADAQFDCQVLRNAATFLTTRDDEAAAQAVASAMPDAC